jgi:hypothetical protein
VDLSVTLSDVPRAETALSGRPPPGSYLSRWMLYSYPFRNVELAGRQDSVIKDVLSRQSKQIATRIQSGLSSGDPELYRASLAQLLALIPSEQFPTFEIFPELCGTATNWLVAVTKDLGNAADSPLSKSQVHWPPACKHTNDAYDLEFFTHPKDFAQAIVILSEEKPVNGDWRFLYRWELLAYPFRPTPSDRK